MSATNGSPHVNDGDTAVSTAWKTSKEKVPEACYVRALYPFTSVEASSLAFRPGDLIRVLTKLESGWWDGLLHGHRGWFPSNYVEEIDIVDSDDEEEQGESPNTETSATKSPEKPSSTSSSILHTPSASADVKNEAAFWIPQTNSEGRVYFFNSITGETQWDVPFTSLANVRASATIAARRMPLTSGMRPPLTEPGASIEKAPSKIEPQTMDGWTDIAGDTAVKSVPVDVKPTEDSGEVLLFAMPDQKPETFDQNFFTTGLNTRVYTKGSTDSPVIEQHIEEMEYPILNAPAHREVSPYVVDEVERSLASFTLSDRTSQLEDTLTSLKTLVAAGRHDEYTHKVDYIRSIISRLVQSLGLTKHSNVPLELLSPELAQHPSVVYKSQYRQMLAILSKLIVSAHVASSQWNSEESASRMLSDAADLQSMVSQLVTSIHTAMPELKGVSLMPAMVANRPIGGGWHGNGRLDTPEDGLSNVPYSKTTLALIERCTQAIQAGIRSCRNRLAQYEACSTMDNASAITRDTIEVVSRVREMLSTCERADLSVLDPPETSKSSVSPTLADFAKAKQVVYDVVAEVTMSVQDLSRLDLLDATSTDHVRNLLDCFTHLDAAVLSITMQAEFMLHELTKYSVTGLAINTEPAILLEGLSKDSKVKRIFGEDVPSSPDLERTHTLPRPSSTSSALHSAVSEPTPWYLEYELESDLTYDTRGNVKAGTLLALVERLTRHDHLDSMYNNTFLLTYKSFCTAEELSSLLMQRFLIQPPAGLTDEQLEIWINRKQQPIRLRVFNVMKCWMEQFYQERHTEQTIQWLSRFKDFVENVMSEHMLGAGVLVWMLEQRMLHGDEVLLKKMVMNNNTPAPASILPKNLRKIKLLELDPLEVARQLTIMESTLYNKIKPFECLDKSWSKPDAPEEAENIKAMILHSNQITAWVAEAILYQTDLKKRVSLIKHFVQIAEKCRGLHNFSTLTAIISGLNSAPIHRLRRTWALLNQRIALAAEDLNRLMNSSKNFSQYRDALHQMQAPCVPFLGVYLTDLTFIEDGNPNMSVKARHLINISKRAKTAEVIRSIQQYQAIPYALTVVPEIQNYIRSCMEITRDISELYDISLEREPREREDEKIARLLQESGFL